MTVDHKDINHLQDSIESLKQAIDRLDKAIVKFSETFVTKQEIALVKENFELKIRPLEKVVYRVLTVVGGLVIAAIVAQVIIQK